MMKRNVLLIILFITTFSYAQGPRDYVHRYEFNNTMNNTQGNNPLSGSNSFNYESDRFASTMEAINPNASKLEAPVVNNTSSVSFSFWIKAPLSTSAGDIVAITNQNATSRMIISKNAQNKLVATFTISGSNLSTQLSNTVFDNQWHHIAFTTKPNSSGYYHNQIYVDGTPGGLYSNINPFSTDVLFINDGILAIAGSNQFNGIVDDVRVYNRELSSYEVNSIFKSYVIIPDANFKAELVNNSSINTSSDNEISLTEAQAYTGTIDVANKSISNLTGIEAFTNASVLYANNNQLTTLNVSKNTNLTTLYVNDNQLTNLDVSANTALTVLYAFNNKLTSLNVANGNNSAMTNMRAEGNNRLACIKHDTNFDPANTTNNWVKDPLANWNTNCVPCSNNIISIPNTNFKNALLVHGAMQSLNNVNPIRGQGISVIDTNGDGEICGDEAYLYTGTINVSNQSINNLTGIEAFTNASVLYANNNQLTTLDVSNNTKLRTLYVNDNQLTDLDVSANTALTVLYAFNNQLTRLNVANGNNSAMTYMRAQGNTNACIQHDGGSFNPTTNNNWTKDATANWSTNCPAPCASIVNIPNTNFKNALLAHGATQAVNGVQPITGAGISVIDTDGDGKICTTEATAYTGEIHVASMSISNLTGIEAFTNLTGLYCNDNQLTNLNLSVNTALINLNFSRNPLTSVDLSANSSLVKIICNNMSSLTHLNVANGNNGVDLLISSFPRLILPNSLDATASPNLSCIQHDASFDPNNNSNWFKDPTANWSEYNCQDVTFWSKATTGVTNDWATASNWTNGVPNSNLVAVFIPTGSTVYPTISTNASTNLVNNLTIENGATLTITPSGKLLADSVINNGTFEINSNATNSGTFEASSVTGNITYNRYVTDKWHLIGAPVSGQDIASFVTASSLATGTVNTNHKGLGIYDNSQTAPWVYYQNTLSWNNFKKAKGYALKRTASGTVAFTGTANTGNFTYTGTGTTNNKFEMLSNPYTRYLDLSIFLTSNTSNMNTTNTALYFWNDAQNRYDVYNSSTSNKYIAPGQGFFAEMANTNGSFAFRTNMTTHNATRALLKTAPQTEVFIHITDGKSQKTTQIKYLANTSKGLDVGYDAGYFDGNQSETGIYTKLADGSYNHTNFMLQCVGKDTADETVIPLGIKTDAEKTVTFTAEAVNLPNNLNVFLEDTKTGKVTELSNGKSYKAKVNNGFGRFYVHTKAIAQLSTNHLDLEKVNIYKQDSNLQVKGLLEASTVIVYNVQGKKVITANASASQTLITLPKLATGMYIVKIANSKGSTSKKIFF